MTNIILSGCNGKMGQVISRLVMERDDVQIVFGFDINTENKFGYPVYDSFDKAYEKGDVVIDFSHPACFDAVVQYCKTTKTPLVMATTGLDEAQNKELCDLSDIIPVFKTANMSLGVNLIVNLVKKAALILEDNFDIEIVEKHHNQKIDAPSGTALMIADEISSVLSDTPEYVYDRHSVRKKRSKKEIGIHAVRGGTIVGEHEIIFAGNDEIIEIKHTAMSKEVFAVGSIKAALYINGLKPGMYDMKNIMEN